MHPPRFRPLTIKHSLRGKIFLRFTLIVGLALIATGSCSVLIAQRAITQYVTSSLLRLADERTESLSRLVGDRRSFTRLLAFGSPHLSPSDLRLSFLTAQEALPELENVFALDTRGSVTAATDSRREGESLADLPYFTFGTQGTYVGTLGIGEGKRSHAIASPLRNSAGKLTGVLVAEFRMEDIYRLFSSEATLGKTEEYFLIEPRRSGSGCVNPRDAVLSLQGAIAPTKNAPSGFLPLANQAIPLCERAAAGEEGLLTGVNPWGEQVVAAHQFLPELGIGVLITVEEEEIFRPITLLMTVLIGTTGILLLLVTFVALRLSRDVITPILSLRRSLEQLDTGHWAHKRSVFSEDELEILDKEVARLATRLEEAYSSLEKKVEERTEQLAEDHAKDEALLESIGEGFLAVDMNGKIIVCNRAAEHLLRWEREQMLSSHFSSCLVLREGGKQLIAPHEHFVQLALDRKATIRSTPHRTHHCERKDGTSFPISITATPFLVGLEMRGVVVTFQDISEEKRIDRMKSEFVSLASHQLRTPLTAVGWYIELLQKEAAHLFSEEQKDYLAQIVSSHQRMVALVNDLLNVSRIELGRLHVDPEHTDLRALVEQIVNELTPQIQEKKLQFKKRLPERLQAFVDPRLLQMVLENLLSNAIKYTPVGGLIELAMILGPQEVRFEVRDTGYGIPASQQHRVFEKLFRADNIAKTDTVGTGIGLYIARSSTEAWGGRLWFESEEGHGTTFYFTVPLEMKKTTASTGEGSSSPH